MGKSKTEIHDFYCLNCGKLSMPLPRKIGRQHNSYHRKKLYCPYCKVVVNHVEIRNDVELFNLKEDFANGQFKDEAAESIELCQKE